MQLLSSLSFIVQRGGAWLFIGHIFTVIGQLVLIKIIAVYGSKELFGQFAIVMAVVTAISSLFYGPLTQWAIRYYQLFYKKKQLKDYFRLIKFVSFLFTISIILIALLLGQFWSDITVFKIFPNSSFTLTFLVLFGVISCFNELLSSIINATASPKLATVSYILGAWVKVLGLLLAIYYQKNDLVNILAFILFFQLFLLLLQYYILFKINLVVQPLKNNKCDFKHHLRSMWAYILPFMLWSIPGYIAIMGDRWVLVNYVDVMVFAEYAAMVFVTMGVANAVNVAFGKATLPIIFNAIETVSESESSARQLAFSLSILLFLGYFLLTVLYYLEPNFFISLFTSADYVAYSDVLWILMVGASAFNLSQFLVTQGLIDSKPNIYLPSKVTQGILIIFILLLVVPEYGVKGAVNSVAFVHIIQLLSVILINRKQNKIRRLC